MAFEYDGKVIHARQVTIQKKFSNDIVDLVTKLIDDTADTLLKGDKM